jgi:chaperonin cofactor prefoldin
VLEQEKEDLENRLKAMERQQQEILSLMAIFRDNPDIQRELKARMKQ